MKKRILALVLASVMALGMAACGSKKEEASSEASSAAETEVSSEEEAPAKEETEAPEEDVATERTGEGKSVTALFFSLEGEYFVQFDRWLQEGLEAKGYKYESQSSNFDPVTQIEQIENAVAKGTTCIWLWALDGKAVTDACKAAKDAGVLVYSFVQKIGDAADVNRGTDEATCGQTIAQMAIEWADENIDKMEDGVINTIFIGNETSENMKIRFESTIEAIKADSRFNILEVVTTGNSTVEGQQATENMYAKYGDKIDAIITIDGATVLGVLAYIDSESCPEADPARLGVFATEIDEELADYMKRGLYDGAGINGGNPYNNVCEQIEEVDKLCNGEIESGYFSAVEIGTCTPDNLADYGY